MSQIRIVSINREKDRFLVCPFVMSWGINRVTDRFFRSLKGPGVTAGDVGVALLDSFAFIERTGPLELSLEEQENFWRHDTRYRTYRAFVRNNDLVEVTNYKDKEYWVYAYPPRIGDDWDDEVWRGTVPAGASAEELGQAVLDAYATIDEWKKAHDGRGASGTPDRVQDHWTGGKEKDMGVMTVSVNREGNRILFLPCVECWGMDRATDRFFRSLRGPDVTAGDIGGALLDAFAFIERTGPLELSLEEQENCWRHDTKYKTYRSFARNNDFLQVSVERGKPYFVCAYPPRTSDLVDDEVWRGTVPAGASAEELGQAVLDAYAAIDEWKKAHGRRAGGREPVARSVALCDGGEVLLPGPGEGFAERTSAAGEVLLAFERAGRGGDPVASLYLAEAEWDAEADGGEAWDEWLERWEGDNGPARSVSREPCGEGPFTRRWEARNGSCLTVALLAPRPDGLAVMLCLDAARPGRRSKAVGRWEEELHRIARAATIRPGKTES
ncbi:hypothetical protein [Bifidobacterium angulatum]|nr:hypothetical protein [Bifidobacterium angulatum]KFI41286.1 hypothetical protein BIANG_0450 [Bifidobacterium angulatum]BAQ96862.1 hypothetical protein BBAG_1240 [Bifidobacterium angulatum DSM 20098 = JCM 7096]